MIRPLRRAHRIVFLLLALLLPLLAVLALRGRGPEPVTERVPAGPIVPDERGAP
jgi:hypothetical protein